MSRENQETLILGAGNVGLSVAKILIRQGRNIQVHCRRPLSVQFVEKTLSSDLVSAAWSGDLTYGNTPLLKNNSLVFSITDKQASWEEFASGEIAYQRLLSMINDSGVTTVVDCLNLATHLSDPSSWPIQIMDDLDNREKEVIGLATALAVIKGHALAIDRLLADKRIQNYVKVSTTGLGKRGLETPFTHGDLGEFLSPNLWRKLYLSGANHQLLWALARSFPNRVRLIVPAAFVGFEDVEEISDGDYFGKVGTVASGENRRYTCEELALISSEYQMGVVSNEEVAEVVVKTMDGVSSEKELLSAMISASLSPSKPGRELRENITSKMRTIYPEEKGYPIFSGSLGPRVDTAINTLHQIKLFYGKDLSLRELFYKNIQGGGDSTTEVFNNLISWIFNTIDNQKESLGEDDVRKLDELLDNPNWSEGDLLALLWRGDAVRHSLL